ncbi:MAG: efflux RND transporter periplasmic adaptor subunit [Neomegalonema sp.]|nr:efflux RND transporter periplasmic adaptor subunit [Neomegalonema sp.]
MRRPMAFWKQAILAALIVGAVYYGWRERESVVSYVSVLRATAVSSAPAADAEKRPAAKDAPRKAKDTPRKASRADKAKKRAGRSARSGRRGRRARGPAPIIVSKLGYRKDDLKLELVGTARAKRSVQLRVAAAGEVRESQLEAGRTVAKGEILLRLEDAAARLAVDLAEARKASADRALVRYLRLEKSGATTDVALDDARTAAATADIELAKAKRALADRRIVAPFAGVLGLPGVEVGDWVSASDVIATLDDRSLLLIEVSTPELLLSRVKLGAPVAARSIAAPGRVFSGKIAEVDSRIDPATRSVKLRVALPNRDQTLLPGASFVVTFNFEGETHPAVPELALQYGRDGLFVWRVKDGVAEQVPVKLIRRQAGVVLLASVNSDGGLSATDLIVVEGAQRVRAGGKVQIVGKPIELPAASEPAK